MADFKGYLIKAVSTNKEFPNRFIQFNTYEASPKQREEIKAYRDDNTRELHRITAKGTKSKISFTTIKSLSLADKKEILKFFTDAESIALERKIQLIYWDDENSQYDTGYFYRPDIQFKIIRVTKDDIVYDELKITLIEY